MKVLIAGGGFGGVRLALRLANKKGFSVRLVSDKNYFEYHAALYRSATGRSPLEVAIPLRDFFGYAKNVEVIEDTIDSIDDSNKTITGSSGSVYPYDKAVFALGNTTQYFNISGLEKYSFGVKDVHQALRLKRHLHEQLLSSKDTDRHYVVVGGGPTGVELAGELTAYLKTIRTKHRIKNRNYKIHLVEAKDHLLPGMPEDVSRKVEDRLKSLGVMLHLSTAVKGETADALQLPSEEIASHSVVWTAGIVNNPFFGRYKGIFTPGRLKRAKVDQFLQAKSDIFCIGDAADTMFSGLAQTALHDADFVADNLLRISKARPPVVYKPKRPVYALPTGPRWSAVLWGKTRVYGPIGWLVRRLADLHLYLMFLPPSKAVSAWRYGMVLEENCPVCKKTRQLGFINR